MAIRMKRYVPRIGTTFRTGVLQHNMVASGWRKVSGEVHTREGVVIITWKSGNDLIEITSKVTAPIKNTFRGRRPPKNYWRVTNIRWTRGGHR